MPSTTVSIDSIKQEVAERWQQSAKTHGDYISIPKDERFFLSEYERAMHVLNVWKIEGEKGSPIRTLHTYGVVEAVILEVVADWCDLKVTEEDLSEINKTEKRADKYDAFIDWTKDKIFEQYTTEQLVEQAGFSYPTVLKFIQESSHFRKIKKGTWEIRDPKADRESEKP